MTTGGFDPNVNPYPPGQPSYPPAPAGYPAPPLPGWGAAPAGRPGGLGARWFARVIDGVAILALSWVLALFFDSSSRIMVTGSANCCLGPYWQKQLGKDEMMEFQASARGGVVRVRVNGNRGVLGGQAVTVMKGSLL